MRFSAKSISFFFSCCVFGENAFTNTIQIIEVEISARWVYAATFNPYCVRAINENIKEVGYRRHPQRVSSSTLSELSITDRKRAALERLN
jgi:hypothetical protein